MQNCELDNIFKLKYQASESERKNLDKIYDYKILMELKLISDTQVTQSKRSSLQILELMGEFGGFYEAIFMLIGLFASSLCSKLFQGNVAASFYM